MYLLTVKWHTKKDDTFESLFDQRSKEAFESVNTPAALIGQGWYLDTCVSIIRNEDGVH